MSLLEGADKPDKDFLNDTVHQALGTWRLVPCAVLPEPRDTEGEALLC